MNIDLRIYSTIFFCGPIDITSYDNVNNVITKVTEKTKAIGTSESCGVVGVGAYGINTSNMLRYETELKFFNDKLAENNIHFHWLRGKLCPSVLFNSPTPIEMSNIHVIPDYSVLITNTINLLCFGGCVPIDGKWYEKNGIDVECSLPFFDKEKLSKPLEERVFNGVVASSQPILYDADIYRKMGSDWLACKEDRDKFLEDSEAIDKFLKELYASNSTPIIWISPSKATIEANGIAFPELKKMDVFDFEELLNRGNEEERDEGEKVPERFAERFVVDLPRLEF